MPRHDRSLSYRAQQTGLLVAATNIPLTFQRTLMPRNTADQALITGLSFAANNALVGLVQESLQSAALLLAGGKNRTGADSRRWSRAAIAVDGAAVVAGFGIQRLVAQRDGEKLSRSALRTAGFWLSTTGTAGGLIGGLQEAMETRAERRNASTFVVVPAGAALAVGGELWRRRRAKLDAGLNADDGQESVVKSLALGFGVALGATALSGLERGIADRIARVAGHVLPGPEELWRPLAHAASIGLLAAGTKQLVERGFGMIETREESVEPCFDLPPLNGNLSGSLDSVVPFETLSKQGRRLVWNMQGKGMIEKVMAEDALDPIRVYVGLESAETDDKRVDLAMQELERTGAFHRAWLLIDAPTGTGYVNYAAVSALEMLSRGNCATVAMQYAARPSPLSLDRVGEGHHQTRKLLEAVAGRLRNVPEGEKPKVVLFGESLGAWTSQDAVINRGTQGLLDLGIDYAIWIGTPHFSQWKEQVLRDHRPDTLPELIGVFNDLAEWEALPESKREQIRYVMITHHNDGVARFGPELIFQAPSWLGAPDTRWKQIPKGMRWFPNTTFFQVLVDMKNSANVVPGQFAATGHDYRADLLPFFRAVLGFKVSDEQMTRIDRYLEDREVLRSEWVKQHGHADTSLAASVLTAWMRENQEQASRVLLERVRELSVAAFVAGGGEAADAPVVLPHASDGRA
jgi:uncharacterized membrane protein